MGQDTTINAETVQATEFRNGTLHTLNNGATGFNDANVTSEIGDINLECAQSDGNASLGRIFLRINHYWNGSNDIFVSANPAYQFALNYVTGSLVFRKNSNSASIGAIVTWQVLWQVNVDGSNQIQHASTIYSGSGAPSAGTGANGDYYFRTDTPGSLNQRIYVKSGGAWSGVV